MESTTERLPTTSAQYGIWMAQQMVPDSPGYLTAEVVALDGPLDDAALAATLVEVLGHCASLHMRFEMNDDGLWQWPVAPRVAPECIDLRDRHDPDAEARKWMDAALEMPCDLTREPLFRTAVLRLADRRHWWYLQIHHIAMDGYGYAMLCRTVAERYSLRARAQTLPPMPDWSLDRVLQAEADYKAHGGFDRDRRFWIDHLAEVPAPAIVNAAAEFSDAVLRHDDVLPAAQVAALQAAARAGGVDWASWTLAAIGAWLARQSGQRHLSVGLPVMNRLGTPALAVPCMAMNIVPLQVHVDPAHGMRELGGQIAQRMRAMRPHLYYRYGWIRGDLGLLEIGKHLFNQAVNLMPFDRHAPFAGLASRFVPVSAGPVKDLNISLTVLEGQWRLLLEANPNAYDTVTLARLHADLRDWLVQLGEHGADAPLQPLLTELPPASVLDGPGVARPIRPVCRALAAVAAECPQQAALEYQGQVTDYAQLLDQVRRLAGALAAAGVRPGDRVVILLPRSPEAICVLLAVLWVGACYVPLDPLGPALRRSRVLADADARLVVTGREWAALAEGQPVWCLDEADVAAAAPQAIPVEVTDDQAAYLLYTSGSTGTPNGVELGHGALAHFVASAGQLYAIDAQDRILQFAPLHFDASVEEIFLALCHGATLVLRDDAVLDTFAAFTGFVAQARLSVLDLPTAYWHELAHALTPAWANELRGVRLTIIGGEAALPERARQWRALLPAQTLVNSYGPTEASVIATTAVLGGAGAVWDGADAVPIGRPRPGVGAAVVDERGYPVAAGRPGELVLSGPALALGYRHQPDLDARRFVRLPQAIGGGRAYRTGDRVCLDGAQLVFLGRFDEEVKISGVRIDPAEVENALLAEPRVREAAVIPVRRPGRGAALAACVAGDVTLSEAGLIAHLADRLPAAAIPDRWHVMDALPRNVNGKIDRKRLEALTLPDTHGELPAASALEQQIMVAWHQVLGRMPEGVGAHFFDLGGKSLQAIQVTHLLGRALDREVPVSALFRYPTVAALARALSGPVAHRPPPEARGHAFAPMLNIQAGAHPALFCLHPAEGLSWCYLGLARHLPDTAIVGVQATDTASAPPAHFDDIVADYARRIRRQQPDGPYRLLGWSLGGALAQAIAVRLQAEGSVVDLVAAMDGYPAEAFAHWREPTLLDALIALLSVNGQIDADDPEAVYRRLLRAGSPLSALGREGLEAMGARALHGMRLFRASRTPRFEGDLLLFHAGRREAVAPTPEAWQAYVSGRVEGIELDCNHFGMSDPRPMRIIGETLAQRFAALSANAHVRGAA